jgi:outer membrane protease
MRFTTALCLLFPLFFALSPSLSAQSTDEGGHKLSWGFSLGFLSGEGEEIVYWDENTKDKLSQLLWEFNALPYAGLNIDYAWQKPGTEWGVFAEAAFKYGFSAKTGVMEDRDWIVQDYPAFLTHYSVHDNTTNKALLFDGSFGVAFRLFQKYWIKPAVAYHFMNFSWTATGGSILYPPTDTNGDGKPDPNGLEHVYLSPINVGKYSQTWHIISPAIAFYGEFNRYFSLEISFKLSPLVWFSGKDDHLLRDLVITEELTGGVFTEPALLFSFKPDKTLTLSVAVSRRGIAGTRGDAEYDEDGSAAFTIKNRGGSGYSAWDAGLVAKWTFSP